VRWFQLRDDSTSINKNKREIAEALPPSNTDGLDKSLLRSKYPNSGRTIESGFFSPHWTG
jgi:hypothetical protein